MYFVPVWRARTDGEAGDWRTIWPRELGFVGFGLFCSVCAPAYAPRACVTLEIRSPVAWRSTGSGEGSFGKYPGRCGVLGKAASLKPRSTVLTMGPWSCSLGRGLSPVRKLRSCVALLLLGADIRGRRVLGAWVVAAPRWIRAHRTSELTRACFVCATGCRPGDGKRKPPCRTSYCRRWET